MTKNTGFAACFASFTVEASASILRTLGTQGIKRTSASAAAVAGSDDTLPGTLPGYQ
jgi:hypothetical protein